jgi:hypothetical protein
MFTTATTSLFHYAADNVSNQYIGDINDEEDWIQNPFNAEPDEEELGIISRNHDYTVEILRKVYGDTVPVFRGISPSTRNPSASKPTRISDDFVTACEDTTEFLHHHRPIESWTFDPGYAARYARGRAPDGESGVLLARDVHTSQILATSATTFALNQYEAEALVMHPQETIYPASHIHPADSLTNQTITEFALDAIANITAPIQKQ